LDSIGTIPITLLVVPDYHRQGSIDRYPAFLDKIESRLVRGDEVALHGYYHLDDAPAPRGPISWIKRRVLTQCEGEFAALSLSESIRRIEYGVELMKKLGWPISGFVPPAWLLDRASRIALSRFPFTYTTSMNGIYRLPAWDFTFSPSLTYSVRSSWRRLASFHLNKARMKVCSRSPVLRISMHPTDVHHNDVMAQWKLLIHTALSTRVPTTKAEWVLQQQYRFDKQFFQSRT